jgi:hypothetical protein
MFWMRHEADNISLFVRDASDVAVGAVGVVVKVSRDDTALCLQRFEGAFVGDEPTLTVLQRNDYFLTRLVPRRPGGIGILNTQPLVAADKLTHVVADERARKEV